MEYNNKFNNNNKILNNIISYDTDGVMLWHGKRCETTSISLEEQKEIKEKFMLDLSRVDAAFIDSRYCSEKDKNTDYSFLYQFAVALINCSKKEFMLSSPFSESIDSKIGNRKH